MPCNNISEVMRVVFDPNDRLSSYYLFKKTCGQGVGDRSLLLPQFRGMSIEELLEYNTRLIGCTENFGDSNSEFLRLKHHFALQSLLHVLTGLESGGKEDVCTVAEVSYDDGNLIIDAEIDIDLLTEAIKACGHCSGG